MRRNKTIIWFKSFTNIFLTILVFLSYGCEQARNEYLSYLSTELRDSHLLMIIPVSENNAVFDICISNTDLYNLVFRKYFFNNYSTFKEFVLDISKGKVFISITKLEQVLHTRVNDNTIILLEYDQFGFDFIKEKYLIEKENQLILKNSLSNEDYLGIIKIMFNKNYFIIEGGYQGSELTFYLRPFEL